MTKKTGANIDYINLFALLGILVLVMAAAMFFTGAGYLVFRGALCMVGVAACSTTIAYRCGRRSCNSSGGGG